MHLVRWRHGGGAGSLGPEGVGWVGDRVEESGAKASQRPVQWLPREALCRGGALGAAPEISSVNEGQRWREPEGDPQSGRGTETRGHRGSREREREREEIHQAGRQEVGVSSGWKILSTLGPALSRRLGLS